MNESLQDALAVLLNKANSGIDAAGNFLEAEIPVVIQQLLLWHGVYNFICFVIGLVLCVGIYKFNKQQCVKNKGESFFPDHPEWMLNAFQLILVFPLTNLINLEWLQIWIAPKVWLLEYAANLAR